MSSGPTNFAPVIGGVLKLSGVGGVIKGLRFSHYYYNCITVLSGDWVVDDCTFENSSTKSRASLGITVKGGVCRLVRSKIEACTRAVSVSSGAELRIEQSHLRNNREAVFAEGGSTLCVESCNFEDNCTCFSLSDQVVGSVSHSTFSNTNDTLWGSQPPPLFTHQNNQVEESPFLL